MNDSSSWSKSAAHATNPETTANSTLYLASSGVRGAWWRAIQAWVAPIETTMRSICCASNPVSGAMSIAASTTRCVE